MVSREGVESRGRREGETDVVYAVNTISKSVLYIIILYNVMLCSHMNNYCTIQNLQKGALQMPSVPSLPHSLPLFSLHSLPPSHLSRSSLSGGMVLGTTHAVVETTSL